MAEDGSVQIQNEVLRLFRLSGVGENTVSDVCECCFSPHVSAACYVPLCVGGADPDVGAVALPTGAALPSAALCAWTAAYFWFSSYGL